MKRYSSVVAAAVAAGLAIYPALAAEAPSSSTDPGFVPSTGQINPGHAARPWSAAAPTAQAQQPPQEEARAALMVPDPNTPSPGREIPQSASSQATTGAGTSAMPAEPAGPIGATVQTMPAKLSARNDLLDHLPVMAWPLRLDQQQRRQIYQAVMAAKSQPAPGADELKPAASLSYEQTRDLHALPQQVAGLDALHGLKYVKGMNKVLLVRPANGVVVDQITM